MVYVVGTAGQVLCVRDAAGQVWQHVFALDGGRTFEGAPPWQLQSPQLASMEIYFQGWRVRPPEAATTRVSLQEIAWR